MSSTERHLNGDLNALEMCRGIGSRPDSGFSDIIARSSTMGEVSDSSFQDSLIQQSSSYGVRSPFGRSPSQETSRSWRPLQSPLVIRPIMPMNSGRAFRPRSAPLALSGFSLLEDEDEDADDEISDHDPVSSSSITSNRYQSQPSHNQAQSIGNLSEHSPPPPAVFIPRDRRRNTGSCIFEMCRCLGSRLSSSSRSSNHRQLLSLDTRSVATQTFAPSFLASCPRPTPHRRLFAAVRPQSAPLQEEEEEEYEGEGKEGLEGVQKEPQVASSWGAHQQPPSPAMSEAVGSAKSSALDQQQCCHYCLSHSSIGRPQSPQEYSQSSSVFVFGEEMLDLMDECGSASSPCSRFQQPHAESPVGGAEVRSPDHEMLLEIAPYLEAPQRPAFVRLRSASAPTDVKDCCEPTKLRHRPVRRRSRRHSYNYENLASIAQRMADAGDAFHTLYESGHRTNSLQWLSSSLVDMVSRPIGVLCDLWTSGTLDTRDVQNDSVRQLHQLLAFLDLEDCKDVLRKIGVLSFQNLEEVDEKELREVLPGPAVGRILAYYRKFSSLGPKKNKYPPLRYFLEQLHLANAEADLKEKLKISRVEHLKFTTEDHLQQVVSKEDAKRIIKAYKELKCNPFKKMMKSYGAKFKEMIFRSKNGSQKHDSSER
ncbi:unnamed protein product [Rodentolepis nana]|uniref:non-specific protein-tyrosine kinase n=1 Tax=Rodentolepis nana TaxID=102285 RepID=A0A0R3TR76_RODNA|nr:unnamed protein product [Rodentolepis nana]